MAHNGHAILILTTPCTMQHSLATTEDFRLVRDEVKVHISSFCIASMNREFASLFPQPTTEERLLLLLQCHATQ